MTSENRRKIQPDNQFLESIKGDENKIIAPDEIDLETFIFEYQDQLSIDLYSIHHIDE